MIPVMLPYLLADITKREVEIAPWQLAVLLLGIVGLVLIRASLGQSKPSPIMTTGGFVALLIAFVINIVSLPWGIEQSLLVTFAWLVVATAIAFVSLRTPVYAALSFTTVVLIACGIYVLNASPFIAASTMMVYAGATIIIFLFVLMFAQRSNLQDYDSVIRLPRLSILVGGLVLAALFYAIHEINIIEPNKQTEQKVSDLGKVMFTEYLWSIEIAGVLLLIAAIAAILIAQDSETARFKDGTAVDLPSNISDGVK
jgi:NADH-quinone oxidoreductase subunit J